MIKDDPFIFCPRCPKYGGKIITTENTLLKDMWCEECFKRVEKEVEKAMNEGANDA